jgi:hypothetical protein
LGDSGDTIIIPAGATITNNGTATGFGRTGTVDWDTTVKTTGFTAVNGVGYFCDTTSSAFTATLPATPTVGAIVAFKDYANTFDTNNLTIGRNGSNIQGAAIDSIQSVEGQSITLIYVDSTKGWVIVDSAQSSDLNQAQFVAATGGTITTCGNYKIHSFTGPGTFTVTSAGNPAGSTTVDYLVVAGGGGGGSDRGGGGGAGGYRESVPSPAAWTASPLANPGGALPVSVQGYPITVGAGGAGGANPGPSAPLRYFAGGGGGGMNIGCAPGTIAGTGGVGGGADGKKNTGPANNATTNTGGGGGGIGAYPGGSLAGGSGGSGIVVIRYKFQ